MAYEDGIGFYGDDCGSDYTPYRKVCRYCGKRGFQWYQTKKGWRLVDKEQGIHSCPEYEENDDGE